MKICITEQDVSYKDTTVVMDLHTTFTMQVRLDERLIVRIIVGDKLIVM